MHEKCDGELNRSSTVPPPSHNLNSIITCTWVLGMHLIKEWQKCCPDLENTSGQWQIPLLNMQILV